MRNVREAERRYQVVLRPVQKPVAEPSCPRGSGVRRRVRPVPPETLPCLRAADHGQERKQATLQPYLRCPRKNASVKGAARIRRCLGSVEAGTDLCGWLEDLSTVWCAQTPQQGELRVRPDCQRAGARVVFLVPPVRSRGLRCAQQRSQASGATSLWRREALVRLLRRGHTGVPCHRSHQRWWGPAPPGDQEHNLRMAGQARLSDWLPCALPQLQHGSGALRGMPPREDT